MATDHASIDGRKHQNLGAMTVSVGREHNKIYKTLKSYGVNTGSKGPSKA